jgi:TIR domain
VDSGSACTFADVKVFISWSGEKSRAVANALREWLPQVLHAIDPFVSSKDIRAGTRWQAEIAGELDKTDFGLICVTQENQDAEWLNFEAGALAKSVESSRVVPLAIDLSPADIANPLGQFQAMRLTKADLTDVLISINEVTTAPIPEERLRKGVEKWWPELEEKLTAIAEKDYEAERPSAQPLRSDRELLEELLTSVRGLVRGSDPRRPPPKTLNSVTAILRPALTSDYGAWSVYLDGDDVVVGLPTGEAPPRGTQAARALETVKIVYPGTGFRYETYTGDPGEDEDVDWE